MQLVTAETQKSPDALAFSLRPISVVFASGEAIAALREKGAGPVPLEPPVHLSEHDLYFLLPDDIGLEIVDIMDDGDLDLLGEAMRDGLFVHGEVSRVGKGRMDLEATWAGTPRSVLEALPYGARVVIGAGRDPLAAINALPHLKSSLVGECFDDAGLEKALRAREYVGTSYLPELEGVDPTYVWSRRTRAGVGIELVLFREYEELAVLVKPVELVLTEGA